MASAEHIGPWDSYVVSERVKPLTQASFVEATSWGPGDLQDALDELSADHSNDDAVRLDGFLKGTWAAVNRVGLASIDVATPEHWA